MTSMCVYVCVCECVCANSMHIPGAADPGSVGNHDDHCFTMETTVTPFTRPPLLLLSCSLLPPPPPHFPPSECLRSPMISVDPPNTRQVDSLHHSVALAVHLLSNPL